MANEQPLNGFRLTSPAFGDNEEIPAKYTCKGENISPPLNITGLPGGTKSLALIMHDPDAVSGDFVHWIIWNIPAQNESIVEGSPPVNAVEGTNSAGQTGYMGPCPPNGTGTHHYIFELYALVSDLELPADANEQDFRSKLTGNILANTKLTGLVGAE